MKKTITLLLLLFCYLPLFVLPQQTQKMQHEKFTILSYGEVKDIAFYTKSISDCNLDSWRLQDKRTVLKFDTGFEIELLSATELKNKGFNVDVASFKKEFPSEYEMPLFKIFPNGTVGAGISHHEKHIPAKK